MGAVAQQLCHMQKVQVAFCPSLISAPSEKELFFENKYAGEFIQGEDNLGKEEKVLEAILATFKMLSQEQ